ncbi:prolipoprotein diacylglyceryl transferase [Pseudohongiella nitratireducens]|uniref:Phosphatidylglycerol--prolipoprotein diacylglyceryl transferase n=1 Tax=Pseudohongiella nitratireducens TaxID=1768907 RepID=A0A916VJV1_9GAMM|nr:prolipoprotein diacylglyceryl transferase [Pseudohongiella nitratireducens]GFZ80431.1 prolipoprotein diacylglyceryl transferase [Pseudohongiella nitratireducens]
MLTYPQIDPVAFSLGPLQVHWYGIMYVIAFSAAWLLAKYRAKTPMWEGQWSDAQLSDLVFYGAMGAVLGGRMGSVFFYNFDRFLEDPLWLLRVWEGGMSFHGGFLGVMLAFYVFARVHKKTWFQVLDFIAPLAPVGLGFGRLGNFIGGELWGRPTDVAWGMVFPHVDELPRHASQLYQAALEGVVLFALVWWFTSRPRPRYAASGLFSLGYGLQRFFVEFFREPDSWIGFVALEWLTMGQVLSLPMIFVGIALLVIAYRKPKYDTNYGYNHGKDKA